MNIDPCPDKYSAINSLGTWNLPRTDEQRDLLSLIFRWNAGHEGLNMPKGGAPEHENAPAGLGRPLAPSRVPL